MESQFSNMIKKHHIVFGRYKKMVYFYNLFQYLFFISVFYLSHASRITISLVIPAKLQLPTHLVLKWYVFDIWRPLLDMVDSDQCLYLYYCIYSIRLWKRHCVWNCTISTYQSLFKIHISEIWQNRSIVIHNPNILRIA